MTANEYYKRFTDLSRYCLDIAANPAEMLHRFKLGTKKKWRSMATTAPCTTYQEFYEVLLQVEDSENMPSESDEEEEKGSFQKNNDKGKGQSSQGPRRTQSFKMSSMSSSSSSGRWSATAPRRSGRFTGVLDLLGVLDFRGRGILAVLVLLCAIDVIIGILESVGEVAVRAVHVVKYDIELPSVPKTSRGLNQLSCHLQFHFSSFQDPVAIPRWVVEVLTIYQGEMALYSVGQVSVFPRSILSEWLPISMLEVTHHIRLMQQVDHKGIFGG